MTIKPTNRKKRVPSPANSPHGITSSAEELFKTVEWLRKNFTWKIKQSYRLGHCQGLCFWQTWHFAKWYSRTIIKKHFQRNLMIKFSKRLQKLLHHFESLFQYFRKFRIFLKIQVLPQALRLASLIWWKIIKK